MTRNNRHRINPFSMSLLHLHICDTIQYGYEECGAIQYGYGGSGTTQCGYRECGTIQYGYRECLTIQYSYENVTNTLMLHCHNTKKMFI